MQEGPHASGIPREFRTRGSKPLKKVPVTETIVLAGRNGPEYFLVPVIEDLATQDRELQRAQESGLDKLTDAEIDAEIAEVRAERLRRRESNPRP